MMNFKEFLRLTYGLFMGTSTPFLKPSQRFLYPIYRHEIDGKLGIFLGGSGVCAVLGDPSSGLVINTNQGAGAEAFRAWVKERVGEGAKTIVLNSVASDFSRGLALFPEAERVLVGPIAARSLAKEIGDKASLAQIVNEETILDIAGERVHLIPVGPAATESDLAVYLESRAILFLGPLFYNRVHPVLHAGPALRPEIWIKKVEELLARFPAKLFVPAEGDVGAIGDVREFIDYLRSFTDPKVEFAECRRKFDWPEIPSYTSLEENFDLLREKIKSHTSLN